MDNFAFLTTTDGASIAYRLDGSNDKPAIVLSNIEFPDAFNGAVVEFLNGHR